MSNSNDLILEVISKAVLQWRYLADSQADLDALNRLATSSIAKAAWLSLWGKKILEKQSDDESPSILKFYVVCNSVGRDAVNPFLTTRSKRTKREIREAANKAAELASQLRRLILSNNSLRFFGGDLMHPAERAAHERILRGVINLATKRPRDSQSHEKWFSDDIEGELDELQKRDFPEFESLTTSQAYRILCRARENDDSFLTSLDCFERLAITAANSSPIVPRPNKEMANEHVLAIKVCSTLDFYYGSPLHEIVAGFCSAVFDHPVEADTIKKWWSRKGDDS